MGQTVLIMVAMSFVCAAWVSFAFKWDVVFWISSVMAIFLFILNGVQ